MLSTRTTIVTYAAYTALTALILTLLATGTALADVYVTVDQTIDYDLSSDRVFVGKDESTFDTLPGTATLTVNDGGTIRGYYQDYPDGNRYRGLNVFGENRANINGGNGSFIYGHDRSEINITGGLFPEVEMHDTGTLNVSGGWMYSAYSFEHARLNVDGGEIWHVGAWDNSVANVSGVTARTAVAFGSGIVNISGGTIGIASAEWQGKLNISGGTFDEVVATGVSTANITGGTMDSLLSADYGTFNLYGGTIGSGGISLMDDSVLNIYGTGIGLTEIGIDSDGFGDYTAYSLSGTLQGGQSLNGIVLRDYDDGGYKIGTSNSPVNFATVPEASTATLLCLACPVLGGIAALARRKVS